MGGKRIKKNSGKFMKAIVVFSLLYLISFTAICIWLIKTISYEPATLIQWNFTIFGMELLIMAVKRIVEKRDS